MRWILRAIVLSAILVAGLCGPGSAQVAGGAWTTDPETGCRLWNRIVNPAVTLHWSGPCVGGVAEGEGILEWRVSRKPATPPELVGRHEGRLRDGRREGPGLWADALGKRLQGEWRDDRLYAGTRFIASILENGRATEEFVLGWHAYRAILIQPADDARPGGRYEGGWVKTWYDGLADPDVIGGLGFSYGPHGQGTFTANDGTILEGTWTHGCLRVAGQYTRSLVVDPETCGPTTLPAELGRAPAATLTDAENWLVCAGDHLDFRIVGCTALIESGRQSDASLAVAYFNRGVAYAGKNRPARAVRDYDRAIRLNPSYADAFANRGLAYIHGAYAGRGDRYDQAILDLDEAIRLNPSHANALRHRGLAYYVKGQYDRAILDLDAAIRLDPSQADAFAWRARAYRAKGQFVRALEDFDHVTRLKPADSSAWVERCQTRARAGQLDAALRDCEEVLRLKRRSPADTAEALENRALVHFKAGRFDAAVADFDAALRHVHTVYRLYGRGIARQRAGDTEGGAADIAAAIATNRTVAETMAKHGLR